MYCVIVLFYLRGEQIQIFSYVYIGELKTVIQDPLPYDIKLTDIPPGVKSSLLLWSLIVDKLISSIEEKQRDSVVSLLD